jgi:hypothetical protein
VKAHCDNSAGPPEPIFRKITSSQMKATIILLVQKSVLFHHLQRTDRNVFQKKAFLVLVDNVGIGVRRVRIRHCPLLSARRGQGVARKAEKAGQKDVFVSMGRTFRLIISP